MDTFFSGIPWQITGWGAFILLNFVLIRAIIRGDLVPRQHHQDTRGEADKFRDLYYKLRDAYDEREKTAWSTVEAQGVTMIALIRSVRDYARGGGDADARTQAPDPARTGPYDDAS